MYKTIRVKKRGGGTRLQRVKVLASGKYKFVKNPRSSPKRTKSGRKNVRRGGGRRRVARRRRRRRRSYSMTIPLAPIAGLGAGMSKPITELMEGKWDAAWKTMLYNYTGWHTDMNEWQPEGMMVGILPLVIGLLVHKFVGGPPLNFNRMLARARIPFIRI